MPSSDPYNMVCERCKKRNVEVSEGEDGPWTSGYCSHCNDKLAENYREQQEFAYYHPK